MNDLRAFLNVLRANVCERGNLTRTSSQSVCITLFDEGQFSMERFTNLHILIESRLEPGPTENDR